MGRLQTAGSRCARQGTAANLSDAGAMHRKLVAAGRRRRRENDPPFSFLSGLDTDHLRLRPDVAMLGRTKGEMAVITLVQGFGERVAGGAIGGRDLIVADAGPAGDIDGPAAQMIAIGNAANCAIMFGAAIGAGHLAPPGANLLDGAQIHWTAAAWLLHCPSPCRQRLTTRGLGRWDWFADLANAPIGIGCSSRRSKTKQKQCDPHSHHGLPLFKLAVCIT